MYKFDKLQLTNFLLWQEQEFVFEQGITHIHGDNGSGKSLLFSSLLPLFYDENYLPKSARASLSFYNEYHEYDFTVFNLGKKTNRYEITIDGKEQKTERIADAKSIIEKHWSNNIQDSLFTTTVSLSGLNRHPLSTGKPASRLDWIHETLAYASLLDSYINGVDQQIKDAKENNTKYTLLRNQLDNMEVVEAPTTNVKELRSTLDSIVEEIKTLERKKTKVEYALSNKTDIPDTEPPKYSYKELKTKLDDVNSVISDLEDKKSKFQAQKEVKTRILGLEGKYTGVKKQYQKSCLDASFKAVNPTKVAGILHPKIERLKNQIRESKVSNELYEEQTSLRKFLKKHKNQDIQSKDELNRKKEKLTKTITLNNLSISAHKSGKEYCQVCGSSTKHSNEDLARITEETKKLESQLEKVELHLKIHKARTINLATYTEIDDLESQISKLNKILQYANEYLSIKEKLDDLPKLKDITFDKEKLESSLKRRKILEKQLIDAKVYRDIQKRMEGIQENEYFTKSKKELSKQVDKLERRLAGLYEKQSDLNSEIIKAETNSMLYEKYRRERRALKEQVLDLRKYSRDYKILTVLKKALGRDGFRTKRLESTLELFVDNLNDLAPLLWREPFKFEIETGPRKCEVVIHRNNKVGDAYTLSGSEQRRWQLLAGLAMLRLLPSNRRVDTVLLDELEANMNVKSRHQMMQDFLPELQKTVPNVIIVSPLTTKELSLQPDIAYTVEKRNSKSKLIRN